VKIPRSHPRYASLKTREALVGAHRQGLVVLEGLIAHGRGEAWDYLLGERTIPPARAAERAAAAYLLTAANPVISVNGNVAALAARSVARLARAVPARIEVNLFHRTDARVRKIATILRKAGAREVLGAKPDARIPGLGSDRALAARDGIFSADVVLVPLEDGDRAEALAAMGKTVLAVDLNPLSRTALAADVTVVDELSRALPNIREEVLRLRGKPANCRRVIERFDNRKNRAAVLRAIDARLGALARKR